jgi:hypothetical protein
MGVESGDANVTDEDMAVVFCHARVSACINMRLNAGDVRELHWQAVDTRSYYETEYRIRRLDAAGHGA